MGDGHDMKRQAQERADDGWYRVRIRDTKDMPSRLRNALTYAYDESFPDGTTVEIIDGAGNPTDITDVFPAEDSRSMSDTARSLFRSLTGMLCMLLGVIGLVVQIVLMGRGVLPSRSWLWVVSVILGVMGLASLAYDFLRIYDDQTKGSS